MNSPNDQPPNPQFSTRQFLIILAVVLAFVCLGSLIVIKKMDSHPGMRVMYPGARLDGAPSVTSKLTYGDMRWTNGMVFVPGGRFAMGSDKGNPDESPVHQVVLDGFWMDQTEVTNEEFDRFIKATGYTTSAEQTPDAHSSTAVRTTNRVPGSLVFFPTQKETPPKDQFVFFKWTPGADWRHPEGPSSTLNGRGRHPVVHISWEDAIAYCRWANKRLPTEAEWECAARGGLDRQPYSWGSELTPGGKWVANIWQGTFPTEDLGADGYKGTAPVASFPPNPYGLNDISGNVWEWVADWYQPNYYAMSPVKNPIGPNESMDPAEPKVPKKVMRGGSFLCTEPVSKGYQPGTRMKASPETGYSHTGFRCVKDGPGPTRR